jgi:hypothetical protein
MAEGSLPKDWPQKKKNAPKFSSARSVQPWLKND